MIKTQEDIKKMEVALQNMQKAGGDLVTDAVAELTQDIADAKAALAAEVAAAGQAAESTVAEVADQAKETVDKAETEVAAAEEKTTSWWVQHRDDVFHAVEIIALAYIVARLAM